MDLRYCSKECEKGIEESREILSRSESTFDAACDFYAFCDKCYKTCPYKEKIEHQLKVCCISAKARHGKDTAAAILAEYLENKGYKVLITHFADLLKYICRKFFGWDGNKDETGRTLLQYVGTDVVGAKKPGYWADFLANFLKMFENEWDYVLIPDCRYPIEMTTMENNFDTVLLRVERPGFDNCLTDEQKKHPSETSMDNYCYDAILYNDSDLETFKDKVEWFADNFLLN